MAASSSLAFDQERIGEWAKDRIPQVMGWGEWYQAIGLERGGELIAGVIYNHYSSCDISMHVASEKGRLWATRDFLYAVFAYPFLQLKVNRVTGLVPAKNHAALKFDVHLGFRREGLMRRALPDDDLVVLGMLKSECRWING